MRELRSRIAAEESLVAARARRHDPSHAMDRPAPTPANRFVIDLSVIAANVRDIRRRIGRERHLIATIKADAYGFGVVPVARAVHAAGADVLALVELAQAVALREAGIAAPILLLPGQTFDRSAVATLEACALIPSLYEPGSLEAMLRHAQAPIDCAIKVAVGQQRLGFAPDEALAAMGQLARSNRLRLKLVHTHPHAASADALRAQFERFTELLAQARAAGLHVARAVFGGSRLLDLDQRCWLDGIDPGQALFAPRTQASAEGAVRAHSAFARLSCTLLQVFESAPDADVPAPWGRDGVRRVGVASLGRADGVEGLHAGWASLRGRRVPLLGRPSLEYLRLDLSEPGPAAPGDEVVLIGPDAGTRVGDVLAAQGCEHASDLALRVGPRVSRIHLSDTNQAGATT